MFALNVLLVVCLVAIVYVYAGYPLLVALLARLRNRRSALTGHDVAANDLPSVTLIIAAYNEEQWIGLKLENTFQLDYPADRFQVIVAADGSSDRTPDIVQSLDGHPEVLLSYQPQRQGKMAAINRAMNMATGQIVVFSDANNMYEPSTIRQLVKPFSDPTVGCATGAKTIQDGDGNLGSSEGAYWRYESWIKRSETTIGCCSGVAGEIMALRRELFEPAPVNVINDDFYMAMRIVSGGHDIVYTPDARSTERVSPSAQDEIVRRSRIVAGRYQAISMGRKLLPWKRPIVAWQIVSHKYLRPLVPLFMLGALVSNLAIVVNPSSRTTATVLLLIGQLLFYCVAWIGGRVQIGGPLGKLLHVPTFLLNSNWAALRGLIGYLRGNETALWHRAERRQSTT